MADRVWRVGIGRASSAFKYLLTVAKGRTPLQKNPGSPGWTDSCLRSIWPLVSIETTGFRWGLGMGLIPASRKKCSAFVVQYKSWGVYPYWRCNFISCFSYQSSTLPTALLKQCTLHTVRSFRDLINCSMMTSRVSSSTPFPSGSQVLWR